MGMEKKVDEKMNQISGRFYSWKERAVAQDGKWEGQWRLQQTSEGEIEVWGVESQIQNPGGWVRV